MDALSGTSLDEIFRCFVCLNQLVDPHMCPSCSKMGCYECMKRWITQHKAQCPHCRVSLRVSQLVNCRFVSEVTAEIEKLKGAALDPRNSAGQQNNEMCTVHDMPLNYYCNTCQVPVCSDCAMFGEHKDGHKFQHIKEVYHAHVESIRNESANLRRRLKELTAMMHTIDSNIERVTKAKEERALQIQAAMEDMNKRLELLMKQKLAVLFEHKGAMEEEIILLEDMLEELNRQVVQSPMSHLIARAGELTNVLKEVHRRPYARLAPEPVSADFPSEIVPEYVGAEFKLSNYSKIRFSEDNPIVYSEPLHTYGLVWRLKVYPNGNGNARGKFISVFLEMVSGLTEITKYEYRVEMVNRRMPKRVIVREFESDFEVGECWGYNKFFEIDFLVKQGYLIPEEDCILFKFSVRPPTYYLLCRDQKRYIELLEAQRNQNSLMIRDSFKDTELKSAPSPVPMHSAQGTPVSKSTLTEANATVPRSGNTDQQLNRNMPSAAASSTNKSVEPFRKQDTQSQLTQSRVMSSSNLSKSIPPSNNNRCNNTNGNSSPLPFPIGSWSDRVLSSVSMDKVLLSHNDEQPQKNDFGNGSGLASSQLCTEEGLDFAQRYTRSSSNEASTVSDLASMNHLVDSIRRNMGLDCADYPAKPQHVRQDSDHKDNAQTSDNDANEPEHQQQQQEQGVDDNLFNTSPCSSEPIDYFNTEGISASSTVHNEQQHEMRDDEDDYEGPLQQQRLFWQDERDTNVDRLSSSLDDDDDDSERFNDADDEDDDSTASTVSDNNDYNDSAKLI